MAGHPPIILENPTQLVESKKFPPPPLKTNTTNLRSQYRLYDVILQLDVIEEQVVKRSNAYVELHMKRTKLSEYSS